MIQRVAVTDTITIGGEQLVLASGPCAVENDQTPLQIAEEMCRITGELGIGYIFKASYDKANRTSHTSFRSIGFDKALDVLKQVRDTYNVPILTDVHEPQQVAAVAEVASVLQIPAFLCRQTDLLQAAGETGLPVKIKRGQFMAPEDMQYAVNKITATGNDKVILTERGVSFGYHNLVVDMRALPIMRQYAPVIFDVTHSVQLPGGGGGKSSGARHFAPYLARAAAGAGVDGFFIETHPTPPDALSDGPNMIPLSEMHAFLDMLQTIWQANRPYVERL